MVTPGTLTNSQVLEESKNNYLMGIVYIDGVFGVSTVDVSTGDYLVTEVRNERSLLDEIYKFSPIGAYLHEVFTCHDRFRGLESTVKRRDLST